VTWLSARLRALLIHDSSSLAAPEFQNRATQTPQRTLDRAICPKLARVKATKIRRGALAVLAALAAVEVGARVVLPLAERGRGIGYDSAVGWRPRPNVVRVGTHWSAGEPARTNSLGWRDAEFRVERTPGVRRLIALGDSFTWGAGVDYGERWTEKLEGLTPDLEVLNLGVNAFGCDQELRLLETQGLAFAPDFVVLTVFLGNDFDDLRYSRRFDWPKPHYRLEAGALRLTPPVRTWDVGLRESSYLGEAVFRALRRTLEQNVLVPELAQADTTELLAALLTRAAQLSGERGARALVVLVYPLERGPNPPLERERRLGELLAAADVPTLDLQRVFAAAQARGEDLYLVDGHWNAKGHDLAARELASALSALETSTQR
jgi:lysophospholipase L1-like esterase